MYREDMFRDIKFTELISFSYDSEYEVIVKRDLAWNTDHKQYKELTHHMSCFLGQHESF